MKKYKVLHDYKDLNDEGDSLRRNWRDAGRLFEEYLKNNVSPYKVGQFVVDLETEERLTIRDILLDTESYYGFFIFFYVTDGRNYGEHEIATPQEMLDYSEAEVKRLKKLV